MGQKGSSSRFNKEVRSTNILKGLRERNVLPIDAIDPEIAAETVKLFILPMIEADTRNLQAKNRSNEYGTANLDLPQVRLSDTLESDL